MSGNVVVEVAGILTDPNFQRMRSMALQLREQVSSVTVIFHSMVEADYVPFLDKRGLLLQFPHHNTSAPIAFMPVADSNNDGGGDTYIGDTDAFLDLCAQKYQLEDTLTGREAIVKATEAWEEYRSRSRNIFCFFKFASDDQQFNDRVVIELFQDVCPLACENFATLCRSDTKNGYNGLPVHRIVPGGWIQSGDVESGGRGDGERGGIVHEDGLIEDEAFSISHDKPGIVSMANNGPHSNGAQFFITLAPLPWLDKSKGMTHLFVNSRKHNDSGIWTSH
ncbi:putative inactive peptidyl-prolyl cis-trans isomerase-like 6 [Aphanomyces cochlioides]|nr:putative inactive peptidyl-prolyl cis-trans isomerase-like 6 [Aphanomyces cochlioides]